MTDRDKEYFFGEELQELIPQRPPMQMVDTFCGISDGISRSGLTVTPENVFCIGGRLAEPGIVEHMAQSAAARIGYLCRREGREVPLGYIASIDRMAFYFLPETGQTLDTSMEVLQEVFGITLAGIVTRIGNEVVAEGVMKIFLETGTET